jgi:hypothetical protein
MPDSSAANALRMFSLGAGMVDSAARSTDVVSNPTFNGR